MLAHRIQESRFFVRMQLGLTSGAKAFFLLTKSDRHNNCHNNLPKYSHQIASTSKRVRTRGVEPPRP